MGNTLRCISQGPGRKNRPPGVFPAGPAAGGSNGKGGRKQKDPLYLWRRSLGAGVVASVVQGVSMGLARLGGGSSQDMGEGSPVSLSIIPDFAPRPGSSNMLVSR